MKRETVDSSAIREIGHDETGCEVQYHRTGCARQSRAVVDPDLGTTHQAACNCEGGDVYFHSGVPAELHSMVMAAPSVGAFFNKHVKAAKHPETGQPLYPHVKRNGPAYTGI